MINGKRGILLKEVLYLVLALLVIAVIVYGFTNVFQILKANKEKNQALGTLQRLDFFIKDLKDGESKEFLVLSPKKYFLVGAVSASFTSRACEKNSKCVCICETSDCSDDKSFCRELSKRWKWAETERTYWEISIDELIIESKGELVEVRLKQK